MRSIRLGKEERASWEKRKRRRKWYFWTNSVEIRREREILGVKKDAREYKTHSLVCNMEEKMESNLFQHSNIIAMVVHNRRANKVQYGTGRKLRWKAICSNIATASPWLCIYSRRTNKVCFSSSSNSRKWLCKKHGLSSNFFELLKVPVHCAL